MASGVAAIPFPTFYLHYSSTHLSFESRLRRSAHAASTESTPFFLIAALSIDFLYPHPTTYHVISAFKV